MPEQQPPEHAARQTTSFPPTIASPIAESNQQQETDQPKVEILQSIHMQLFAEFFSGPLPHPDILAKFEKVVPGSAARIIKMAEDQSAHRRDLERTVIRGDDGRAWYGLWTGFALGMLGLGGSIALGLLGQPWLATFISGGTLSGLVGIFVYGTKTRQQERAKKAQAVAAQQPPGSPPSPSPTRETPPSVVSE
jgi:uncharacterized membrane protein